MPIVLLAAILLMMTFIAGLVIVTAWNRIPVMRWFAGLVVVVEIAAVVLAIKHVQASRADLEEGRAQIRIGRVTSKRTGGRPSTWHYATLDGIGEVEVTTEQFNAMAIGSSYTVSFSPRICRAWTVEKE